jgi:hypothetical protein
MTDQEGGEVRWRLQAPGHAASWGAGRAGAEAGTDVGARRTAVEDTRSARGLASVRVGEAMQHGGVRPVVL